MAFVASPAINWASPTVMPRGPATPYPSASMYVLTTPLGFTVIAAPQIYGGVVPNPPPPSSFSFG